jgi:tetratricopeptide (TPR) repeat protein
MAEESRTMTGLGPKKAERFWLRSFGKGTPWLCRLGLIGLAALAGGCDSATTGGHAMKTRGVYTTPYTPELAPLASFDLPGAAYFPCDNFGPDETPIVIVLGYDGDYVTMELIDLTTGETMMSENLYDMPGRVSYKPLFLTKSGEYEVRLLLRDEQVDAYKFSVMREPLKTSAGRVNYDAIIMHANEELRYNPSDGLAYLARASAHAGKGETDEAIADYGEAIRLRPQDATAHALRGLAYSKQRKFDEAVEDMTEFIRLKPDDPRGPGVRAVFYERSGDFEKGIADARESLRIMPDYYPAANTLAWMLAVSPRADLRNGKEAVTFATSVCEATHWKNSQYVEVLAAAYAESGDFESAAKYQKQAMDGGDVTAAERAKLGERLGLYQHRQAFHMPDGQEAHAP